MANDQLIHSEVTDEYTTSYGRFLMANMAANSRNITSLSAICVMLLWDDAIQLNTGKHISFYARVHLFISSVNVSLERVVSCAGRTARHKCLLWFHQRRQTEPALRSVLKAYTSSFSIQSSQWLLPRNLHVLHHMNVTFSEQELQKFVPLWCCFQGIWNVCEYNTLTP